jgi:hypothetical protein
MSNFGSWLRNGVSNQYSAQNMTEALKSYNDSCLECSMFQSCGQKRCSIERAFRYNLRKYQNELERNPSLRKEVELALVCEG